MKNKQWGDVSGYGIGSSVLRIEPILCFSLSFLPYIISPLTVLVRAAFRLRKEESKYIFLK